MATLLALRNHLPSSELTRQWIFFHCYVSFRGKNKFLVSSDSRLPKIDISLTFKVSFNKIWGKRLSPCNLCGHLANQLVGWKSPRKSKNLCASFRSSRPFSLPNRPSDASFWGAPKKKKSLPNPHALPLNLPLPDRSVTSRAETLKVQLVSDDNSGRFHFQEFGGTCFYTGWGIFQHLWWDWYIYELRTKFGTWRKDIPK